MEMPPLRALSATIAVRGTCSSKLTDQLPLGPFASGPSVRIVPPPAMMRTADTICRASASVSADADTRERTRTSGRSQPRTRIPPLRPASTSSGLTPAPGIVSSRTSQYDPRSELPESLQDAGDRPAPRPRVCAETVTPSAAAARPAANATRSMKPSAALDGRTGARVYCLIRARQRVHVLEIRMEHVGFGEHINVRRREKLRYDRPPWRRLSLWIARSA